MLTESCSSCTSFGVIISVASSFGRFELLTGLVGIFLFLSTWFDALSEIEATLLLLYRSDWQVRFDCADDRVGSARCFFFTIAFVFFGCEIISSKSSSLSCSFFGIVLAAFTATLALFLVFRRGIFYVHFYRAIQTFNKYGKTQIWWFTWKYSMSWWEKSIKAKIWRAFSSSDWLKECVVAETAFSLLRFLFESILYSIQKKRTYTQSLLPGGNCTEIIAYVYKCWLCFGIRFVYSTSVGLCLISPQSVRLVRCSSISFYALFFFRSYSDAIDVKYMHFNTMRILSSFGKNVRRS